ncbi:MAG: hypothetical protein JWL59_2663 [Chthoniobacteraceae bacterium]|nr:hypothetical protein [Chthoniobacteraceae bacterium]
MGVVSDPAIKEASGLVVSSRNPGILWTHNDSSPHLYALRKTGELVARIKVPDAAGGNFEDLAVGPGPLAGTDYLYLADIGDNRRERDSVAVFRMPEPNLQASPNSKKSGPGKLHEVKKIILKYPDERFNAESLLIDPLTGDLFIATKEKKRSRVYTALKAQLESDEPVILKLVCEIRMNSASGAAISRDGHQIVLRNEDYAQMWNRPNGVSVADAFRGLPTRLPVIGRPKEPNGEAIAFDPSGHGYYTISEGINPPIYFFNRP